MFDPIFDFFKWLGNSIIEAIFSGVIFFLELIPVPDFFNDLVSNANSLSGQTTFWLGVLKIDVGVSMILGAYIIRFIIRRTPFVG